MYPPLAPFSIACSTTPSLSLSPGEATDSSQTPSSFQPKSNRTTFLKALKTRGLELHQHNHFLLCTNHHSLSFASVALRSTSSSSNPAYPRRQHSAVPPKKRTSNSRFSSVCYPRKSGDSVPRPTWDFSLWACSDRDRPRTAGLLVADLT